MNICRGWVLIICIAIIGCAAERAPAPTARDSTEKAVVAVISEFFKVDASAIVMDRSISDPPLNADDLDVVEIVMDLEERLGIEISDEAVERVGGGKLGGGPIRITPNQLVSLARQAPKLQHSRRKK